MFITIHVLVVYKYIQATWYATYIYIYDYIIIIIISVLIIVIILLIIIIVIITITNTITITTRPLPDERHDERSQLYDEALHGQGLAAMFS